jgi:hypothetical protein
MCQRRDPVHNHELRGNARPRTFIAVNPMVINVCHSCDNHHRMISFSTMDKGIDRIDFRSYVIYRMIFDREQNRGVGLAQSTALLAQQTSRAGIGRGGGHWPVSAARRKPRGRGCVSTVARVSAVFKK